MSSDNKEFTSVAQAKDLSEFKASFRIMGRELDLDLISTRLEISPTRVHRAGELDILRKPFANDMWLLQSPLSVSFSFDDHILWMTSKLVQSAEFLKKLPSEVDVCIICDYRNYNCDQGGFALSPTSLKACSELGVRIEFHLLLV